MFGTLLAGLGASIGGYVGGGILSVVGRFAGKMLGSYLSRLGQEKEISHQYKNLKESFYFSAAIPGTPLPLVFGTTRVVGKIIWSAQVNEVQNTSAEKRYFQDTGQTRSIKYTTECEYYLSYAVALCEGEVLELKRVWLENDLVNLKNYKYSFYSGSEEQEPDPLISASAKDGKAPAFRGVAYIVFEDLPLDEFGSCVPNFSFEITRKAQVAGDYHMVEDMVKSMVMIPGSGEFVYDTIVQHAQSFHPMGGMLSDQIINSHNPENIANSVYSLNQLQQICPNVEWIAVVACWFGNSVDAASCTIMPGVEFQTDTLHTTENWQVGHYSRETARLISRDEQGNPHYGGSVNDASLLRYLSELKSRNIKVMVYPMIFLDVERKPWRGRITGTPKNVAEFFTKPQGYNEFILHYANLVRDYADAFVIGSELIGLTRVKDGANHFPAVRELAKLAAQVKATMGGGCQVTYAADWSEYHHTEGGWYNLDELWASPNIDFIGIDAYFPVTSSSHSSVSYEEILKGWGCGEGYDYFIDADGNQQPLAPAYAWKNLEYWWSNVHTNPDGAVTEWRPRSKQIWFTEFGFPSVDKASNQPNVFFDPKCIDGGLPKYSNGEVDFSIQRKAIKAFLEYWEAQEYIARSFLWTWDARPYPAWPHTGIWSDGYLWEKGHWVNNKFGVASVAAIILEISQKCGINLTNVDVSDIDQPVEGLVLSKPLDGFEVLQMLRIAYFFDITASTSEIIQFTKRGGASAGIITNKYLIKQSNNHCIEEAKIAPEDILGRVDLYFLDRNETYSQNYAFSSSNEPSNKPNAPIHLPIVMSYAEAQRLGDLIIKNAAAEDRIITFTLPVTHLDYEPGDLIELQYLNKTYHLRIIRLQYHALRLDVTGIFDDASSYNVPQLNQTAYEYTPVIAKEVVILDLPNIFNISRDSAHVIVYLQSSHSKYLYVSLSSLQTHLPSLRAQRSNPENFTKIKNLTPEAVIGKLVTQELSPHATHFTIDTTSKFTIRCCVDMRQKLQQWTRALLGKEIISFQTCNKIDDNLYEISHLIRGQYSTEEYMQTHDVNENFVLLDISPNIIYVANEVAGQSVNFKIQDLVNQEFTVKNHAHKLPAPFINTCIIESGQIHFSWVARSNMFDDWIAPFSYEDLSFEVAISSQSQRYNFNTTDTSLNINIAEHPLSGEVEISIIAKDGQGRCSSPAVIIRRVIAR